MRNLAFIIGLSFFILSCGDDQTVNEACKDIICDEGTCVGGECVNPAFCDDGTTCISGFACDDDNKCSVEILELCLDVRCENGECSKVTGECINKSVCDRETPTDCIEGFACYAQTCQDEGTICAEVNCSRGLCDFKIAECVDGTPCKNDTECLSGSFCNDEKNCEENKCDINMVDCPRGVCNQTLGVCEDASICSSIDDCTDGKYCVGTQCTPIDVACADCTGNQICTENVNLVTCSESADGCRNGLDCTGDRACIQGACEAPVACIGDANEPNNDAASATLWANVVTQGSVSGSLCQADSDYFLYNTRDSNLLTGTLVVSLNVDPQNVGNGNFSIELLKTDGSVVGTQSSNNSARVELRHQVSALDVGEFLIKVSDSDLNLNGVEYELFINVVDAEADLACQNATPFVAGSASGNTSISMSTSLKPSCSTDGVRRESVFTLEVSEKSEVTFNVAPLDATISVRRSCEIDQSEIACSSETGELITTLDRGTYFVLVEGVNGDGPFGITATQKPVICNPGTFRCAAADSETCNMAGTAYDGFSCEGDGCDIATGFCNRAPGDVCLTAIDATQGFDGTVDFSTLRGDYESSVCGSAFPFQGFDYTFRVDLPPNNRVDVFATNSTFDEMAVLVIGDCTNIDQTCLAEETGSTIKTGYENTGTQNESVFIIVDSRSNFNNGPVDVKIDIAPIICVPNTQTCMGNDINICNVRGTQTDLSTCPYGCDTQTDQCNPGLNDTCATAFDATAGGTFSGVRSDYTNDYQPEDCTSSGAPGPDAVWFVNAVAGQALHVSLTSEFDGVLYISGDCADIEGTCLDWRETTSPTETIHYIIPTDGIYYIITDSFSSVVEDSFTLTVDLIDPFCTPGDGLCMGDDIQFCIASGTGYDIQSCPVTCDANTNQCTGNSCASPILISGPGQYIGDTSIFTNVIDAGASNTCNDAAAKDVVYQIDGTPGEMITATVTGNFDSVLYALSDCNNNTCVASTDTDNMTETITFVLPASGSMFVVVDGWKRGDNGAYVLDIAIDTPNCSNPGQAVQCVNATTLEYCDNRGFLQLYGCACSNGVCTDPIGDLCLDVVTVFDQTVITSNYGNFTNTFVPSQCPNTYHTLSGPDAVYAIDLAPNSILTVDLQSSDFFKAMYISSDCLGITEKLRPSTVNTCVRGNQNSEDQIVYHTAQGGTFYVHIDTSFPSSAAFTATFSVAPGVCLPGENVCDPNTVQKISCNDDGSQISTFACISGCATPTDCGGPPVPNDSCATAYNIVAPVSYVEDLSRFTNEITPGNASCLGQDTNGPDLVYSVSLPAGTVLDVQSDGRTVRSVAIVSDCTMPGTTCLAQDDGSGNRRALYASAINEDLFVIIDHGGIPTNEIEVSIDLRPQECTLGFETCLNATTRQYCTALYELETEPCKFGCTTGVCNAPSNELCGGATDATAGGTFTAIIEDYADDYDQDNSGASCTGQYSQGPDAVWSVNAIAGQILSATMQGAFNSSLYISTDCPDIDNSCVVGSDVFPGPLESVQYTIPTDGVYYIVADAHSSVAYGSFTLTIDLVTP